MKRPEIYNLTFLNLLKVNRFKPTINLLSFSLFDTNVFERNTLLLDWNSYQRYRSISLLNTEVLQRASARLGTLAKTFFSQDVYGLMMLTIILLCRLQTAQFIYFLNYFSWFCYAYTWLFFIVLLDSDVYKT